MTKRRDEWAAETLGIALDTLAFIIVKSRAYDAQSSVSELEDGSSPSDDREVSALESGRENPTRRELYAAIAGLTPEEQTALVALAWIGRGDFDAREWRQALGLARERRLGATARYLIGMPLLGDYLEEGAAAMGVNLTDSEASLMP